MKLSDTTKDNIRKAHFVRDIPPENYLVPYKNILELLQVRLLTHPDDTFLVYYPDKSDRVHLTYNDFIKLVFKTGNLLKSLGVKSGDRITTVSYNHSNTVIQYFAGWAIGATIVPININEEPERIKYILQSSKCKLTFVHSDYINKIEPYFKELPDLKHIIIHDCNNEINKYPVFEKLIESQESDLVLTDPPGSETEALIVYTSGTTGLPKGVVLTQYNLLADAYAISKWHKIEKSQTMMCVLPIHHVNGTIVTLVTPMYYGGTVVLNQKFHTERFFERITSENVQIVSVVPTLLQFLCHENTAGSEVKNSFENFVSKQKNNFRHIICGAGPLTCELVKKFEDMFSIPVVHGYGLSETTCYSCFIPVDLLETGHYKWLHNYGFPSIGIPIEVNEMDIHNDKGESMREGERGEIVIRGHNVMKYYDDPKSSGEANDKTFEFGWFRSGDEGFYKLDENNNKYFFITGRLKELIIRGGINIAPLEIDEIIMSHPAVKAGISVGFDNDWYGEEVGAYVDLKQGENISENELITFCSEHLPFYKTPKVIIFGKEIPVTSTGKYQRNKLKNLFNSYKTVQFKK